VFAYAYLADPGGTHFRWKDITRRLLLYLTNDNVLNYHSRHLMALLMWMSSYVGSNRSKFLMAGGMQKLSCDLNGCDGTAKHGLPEGTYTHYAG